MVYLNKVEELKDSLSDIGINLKRLRLKLGHKSYESFAVEHGFSRMQYWRIEKGKSNITVKSLMNILSVYNMSLSDFFCKDFLQNNDLK